jgi:hypothetical protein
MDVAQAIRQADAILPGTAVSNGLDARWQAIIAVGEFIESEPEAVWEFICRWGCYADEDLRTGIATCLLEHLLEYHFPLYYQRVREMALTDPLFADTFLRCWQLGKAKAPPYSKQFESLRSSLKQH